MKIRYVTIFLAVLMLAACQPVSDRGTIARLRNQQVDLEEAPLDGGLEKAMQSYERFLEETPDAAMAPEAMRRLADLKIEREYGTVTPAEETTGDTDSPAGLTAPEKTVRKTSPVMDADRDKSPEPSSAPAVANGPIEAEAAFEARASQRLELPDTPTQAADLPAGADDLERAGPLEAVALYQRLLEKYPLYDRNDQVLYQMSRAYEELGRIEEAMGVMQRMVNEFPQSRYIDEVQFRRAEFFFSHRKLLDAEEAYKSIVDMGEGSYYYELALYKLGWTFYKQELYEDAQHRFIALLDHKATQGLDFERIEDKTERKRMEDTFRVISLGFSNLGGANAVVDYFSRYGERGYEDSIYKNLAEFYFIKRRYADASASYDAFISRNPFHKVAPNFHMRVIEIHAAGGFPSLVLESKRSFASTYGLKAEYWQHFDPNQRQDVLDHLKTNLIDLANHFHAAYQKPRKKEDKGGHYKEALHWYRGFLTSFPDQTESPGINFQMAELLLENKAFGQAAVEYEKTAYGYDSHEKAPEAGYAAVYAHRKHLAAAAPELKVGIKSETVRSSLTFVDTFPKHEKADIVLGAAAEDLYAMKAYEQALAAGTKLIAQYPGADKKIIRTAWLVNAHSAFELQLYREAETAYLNVLALLPEDDKSREGLVDNLAAAIYKQGEAANAEEDYRAAANHFLRVGRIAPTSKIRATAEYDGAAALIQLEDWTMAATVLTGFRKAFPGHELQPEVTKKIAFVYKENGQLSLAAEEYERIETESKDDDIRRDALLVAADLYTQDEKPLRALEVFRRYVGYFPQPVDLNIETRHKIAGILKAQNDRKAYLAELGRIVDIDAKAGDSRTPRTRYLAGKAALVLAEASYERFVAVRLVKPFKKNLSKKQKLMKQTTRAFNQLVEYEMGDVTAAATFYLGDIYAHFSQALMTSERPEGLNPLELEQYEFAIEEQAYPFEEKAIEIHESNLKLIARGVYNQWIDKSLAKLAEFMPARYDKAEQNSAILGSPDVYTYAIARPAPPEPPAPETAPAVAEADADGNLPMDDASPATTEDGTAAATSEATAGDSAEAQPKAPPTADKALAGETDEEQSEATETTAEGATDTPQPDQSARPAAGDVTTSPEAGKDVAATAAVQ